MSALGAAPPRTRLHGFSPRSNGTMPPATSVCPFAGHDQGVHSLSQAPSLRHSQAAQREARPPVAPRDRPTLRPVRSYPPARPTARQAARPPDRQAVRPPNRPGRPANRPTVRPSVRPSDRPTARPPDGPPRPAGCATDCPTLRPPAARPAPRLHACLTATTREGIAPRGREVGSSRRDPRPGAGAVVRATAPAADRRPRLKAEPRRLAASAEPPPSTFPPVRPRLLKWKGGGGVGSRCSLATARNPEWALGFVREADLAPMRALKLTLGVPHRSGRNRPASRSQNCT